MSTMQRTHSSVLCLCVCCESGSVSYVCVLHVCVYSMCVCVFVTCVTASCGKRCLAKCHHYVNYKCALRSERVATHTCRASGDRQTFNTHTQTCAEYPCIFVLCVLRCGIYTSVSVRVGYAKRSRFCTLARPPDDSNYPAVILPSPATQLPAQPFLSLSLSLTNRKLQQCCH